MNCSFHGSHVEAMLEADNKSLVERCCGDSLRGLLLIWSARFFGIRTKMGCLLFTTKVAEGTQTER